MRQIFGQHNCRACMATPSFVRLSADLPHMLATKTNMQHAQCSPKKTVRHEASAPPMTS